MIPVERGVLDRLRHDGSGELLEPQGEPNVLLPLITFGLARGINNGVLDRKVYGPVADKAWAGMLTHIYADGRLGCIQQTGAEPAFYYPSSSYDYGIGGFLLAGSEVKKMAGKK